MVNRERSEVAALGFRQALRETEPVSAETLERLWDALHRWDPGPPDEPTLELPAWHPPPPRLPRRHAQARHRRPRTGRRMLLLYGLPAVFGIGVLLSALH
ncbi:hypothetical protein ACX9I7_01100 [Streptomyces sp. L500]